MKNISNEFDNDLIQVVDRYFPENKSREFVNNFLLEKKESTNGLAQISELDRSQLNFEVSSSKERISIDKTITFAANKLPNDSYFQMLTKLSELCISHGMLNFAHEIITKIKKECRLNSTLANSLLVLSDLHARKCDWEKSIDVSNEAKVLFQETNDVIGVAKCENTIGTVHGEKGNLEKAKEYFEKSLELATQGNDTRLMAMLDINLGIIQNIYENYEAALNYFNQALVQLEELKDFRRIAEVRHNIGMVYKEQKYYHSALQEFDTAIGISITNEFHPILAISYISKAEILLNLGEAALAAAVADKAMEVAHIIDDKITIAEVYRLQGIINRNLKNFKLSENNFLSAIRINIKLNIDLNVAECYSEIAELYRVMGNIAKEQEYLNLSLTYYKNVNAADHIAAIEDKLKKSAN